MGMSRLLVVSHPAVLPVNQLVYAELMRRGWDVELIVPALWRHEYEPYEVRASAVPEFESHVTPIAVAAAGRPQRHFYRANPMKLLRRLRPDVVFLEQEPFALVTAQWGLCAARWGVPFGVQQAENVDRGLPWPVRVLRTRMLRSASFVAARSPRAAELALAWGAHGDVRLVPHHVPAWSWDRRPQARFTVGYAGRLTSEKGLDTLVAAVRRLAPPVDLLVVGDGALRGWLERVDLGEDRRLELRTDVVHEDMASAYAAMDILVLPSRTTPHWTEQFGRVLVEALWCGVPVVGSDSGEIPWVVNVTRGGAVFPEGDEAALACVLDGLRADRARRDNLATEGRTHVAALFSVEAVADVFGEMLGRAIAAY